MLTRDYEVPDRLPYTLPAYSREASAREASAREASAREASPAASLVTAPIANSDDRESFLLLSVLVDALPKGLIVLSIDRDIIYWNQNAKRLCQELSSNQRYWTTLPLIVAELCDQVVDANATTEPVLVEYQTPDDRSFRLTACWLAASLGDRVSAALRHQAYILVTVEDRDEVLLQDIQAEQKKFHLTNREAEIWLLLKREYSYQAIASKLHISLNTVKTHVRNIHAKRHPYQSLPA